MSKRVFSMAVTSTEKEIESVIHAGVVSLMPNLGGILIQMTNGDSIQIEYDEMTYGFSTEFLYLSEDEIKNGETRIGKVVYRIINHTVRKNENWHTLCYSNYGTDMMLENKDKEYTLLCNQVTQELVVAYRYNSTYNTWAQGHYFTDLHEALEFMYAH